MEQTQSIQPQVEPVGFPGTPPTPSMQPKKSWKWLIILVLFLVVIGGVTYFVFKSSKSASSLDENSPTPAATIDSSLSTPTPSPSATPANKSALNISVLNGTGIAGEAGLLSTQLKALGYTNVTTGNATSQNVTDTSVVFSPTVGQDVVTEITSKLKDMYINVNSSTSSLSGSDIQITTGTRKGQTASSPSPSTSASPTGTSTPTAAPTATP